MARQLIDSLTADFEPEKYRDEYRERVLDMIERKAQGETVVIETPAEEPAKVPDLMAALEASIASAKGQSKPKAKRGSAKKRKAAAKA
jgi:DNA end-binding protein Ku